MQYNNSIDFARSMDKDDPLSSFREKFHIPQHNGEPCIYFCGNSLGLQPKATRQYINQELDDWERLGVEGHFHAKKPWKPYHEFLTEQMATIVGAKPEEVVVMNALTVNLHLMMASFYKPTKERHKIIIEANAFPSDQYAVKSQIEFHGFESSSSLIEIQPESGNAIIPTEKIERIIDEEGDSVALILIGGVNYYSGQAFEMDRITKAGQEKGCIVGFDLAHAVGNLQLELHNWDVDFAAWCSYKYLNSGPGGVAGVYINERHIKNNEIPRFAGWWGNNKETRFLMGPNFDPIPTAEGWQLSNAPIFSMAALRASLDIFEQAGMEELNKKSSQLTGYLEYLIDSLDDSRIEIITPRDTKQRGCQLSIRIEGIGKMVYEKLTEKGFVGDWREPDIIRVAPVPLYNNYMDAYKFVQLFKETI